MSLNSNTRKLVEGAMLIALATVLSYIKLLDMPFGGSITLEMIPLVIMGLRNGPKWGLFTGFVHGILQMIIGFQNVMYCSTLVSQIGCILLDYVFAFSVLGLAATFAAPFKSKKKIGYVFGSIIVGLLRFVCSFLSGWILWGSYAPDGMNPAYYSLVYNGAYMLPNTIILAIVVAILAGVAPRIFFSETDSVTE